MSDDFKDFEKELDKVLGQGEVKKPTPSIVAAPVINDKIVKENKKLKTVGWVASGISFVGIFLNAYKMILCWPIWCVANIFWIYWATKKKEWSQVFLWVVFTLANLYGWYLWATM